MELKPGLRTLLLRQAGLLEAGALPADRGSIRLALIDGAVNSDHPALRECAIVRIGGSRSDRAKEHATFMASILTGSTSDLRAGRVMGICSGCTILNFAVVTDELLEGGTSRGTIARVLAGAVDLAVDAKCGTIAFGIQIRQPDSDEWRPLRESLTAAAGAGSAVIMPAGNRLKPAEPPCRWPEVLVTASRDWRGRPSVFSPTIGRSSNTIFAPGENVPGAASNCDYVVRSGTSFAAAIAAGAYCLATCLARDRSVAEIAAALFRPPQRILDGSGVFHPTTN